MNTYTENKQILDKIRYDFGSTGEIIFRTAVKEVISRRQITFLDDGVYEDMQNDIDANCDYAESHGKNLLIKRNFEKAIVKCARKLSEIDPFDLITYIQKEVYWSDEGGITYGRLYQIVADVMEWVVNGSSDSGEDYDTFSKYCCIADDELDELGFGYMIPDKE